MYEKTVVIGCDNAAVVYKNSIMDLFRSLGYNIENVGVDSEEDGTYYPLIAQRLCEIIISSGYEKKGVLLCGTGIGMAMTANKFPGIYAGVCHDNFSAERARMSNDANVLCLGARVIGLELAKKITREWIDLEFQGGSSKSKVEVMHEIDEQHRK